MPGEDQLVQFLRQETGERLHFVLTYDTDSWTMPFVSNDAEDLFASMGLEFETLLETFEKEGERNARLQSIFELGWYYCSLHLFEATVVIHFFQYDGHGVIFGFHPSAASHLTAFVSLIIPYVREAGLEEIKQEPAWGTT